MRLLESTSPQNGARTIVDMQNQGQAKQPKALGLSNRNTVIQPTGESDETISCHQLADQDTDDKAWPGFVTVNGEPDAPNQRTRYQRRLYELLLCTIMISVAVGIVLGQKWETRLRQLENDIAQMALVVRATAPLAQTTAPTVDTKAPITQTLVLQVLETAHLRFVHRGEDRAALVAVVSKIDQDYVQLRRALALAPVAAGAKHTLYLAERGIGANHSNPMTHTLHTELLGQLAKGALDEALQSREIPPRWQAIINSLYRYLLLNQSHTPALMLQPPELQKRHLAPTYPPDAAQLIYEPGNWMYPDQRTANLVADPLVEYILITYGWAAIPPLLDALSEFVEWEQIAPAAFDITASEFEEAWYTYLRERYPAPADRGPSSINE